MRSAIRVGRIGLAATLGLADGLVLAVLRPSGGAVCRHLAAPHAWVAQVGADTAAAQLAAAAVWCAAVWTALGLLAVLGIELPGLTGRCCRRVARLLLPRLAYRLLAGATGVGVLLTPGLAAATPVVAPPVPAASSTPAPTWPTGSGLPALGWPVGGAPMAPGTAPATPATPLPPRQSGGPASIIVRPGQSLWRIAAEHLPPHATDTQIAAAWPHWYAANRNIVGPDPAHLVPGEVLHAPVSPQEDPS